MSHPTNTTESLDERIRFYYNGAKQGADFDKWVAHLKAYFEQEVLRGRVSELKGMQGCPPILVEGTIKDRLAELNTLLGGER